MFCAIVLTLGLAPGSRSEEFQPFVSIYERWENGPSKDPNYFPIGVWLQNTRYAADYKSIGINTYIGLWKGPTELQLKQLEEAGMKVICSMNEYAKTQLDNPTIIGWQQEDEPDNAQPVNPDSDVKIWGPPVDPKEIVKLYEEMVKTDPTRPIFLNLGPGVANDEYKGRGKWAKPSDYFTYVKGCDILSFDIYPVANLKKPNNEDFLWYVPKGILRLREWCNNEKIIWNIIESANIRNLEKQATPHHVKSMAWMSLIHGSKGIAYFVHSFLPTFNAKSVLDDDVMKNSLTEINHQIQSLAPVLNSPTVENVVEVQSSDPNVPIAVMAKRYGGSLYVFAVSMRNQPTSGTFVFHESWTDATVAVLNENRAINIENRRMTDTFIPYEVHLYKININ